MTDQDMNSPDKSGWCVSVLGGGAWGTALALAMLRAGHSVRLFARDPETVASIGRGENPRYLPGITIAPGIEATSDITVALAGADCVLAVTPAQALRATLAVAKAHMPTGIPLVLCAKGIERLRAGSVEENAFDFVPRSRWPLDSVSEPMIGSGRRGAKA
jgi:glycerol-3-phosphate dehydrogenase (NAD(P)+)